MMNKNNYSSPRKKRSGLMKQGEVNAAIGFGSSVSIFELCESMGKITPINYFTLKLIDNLKPTSFEFLSEEDLEHECVKFAQMKVTHKLSHFNFDIKSFIHDLDIHKNGEILLHELFTELANQFAIYFSQHEQVAIHKALFPD